MPNWPSIEAFVDGVISQTFGEPVVYQPVQAGAAQGSAFTVTAVRHLRVREESGAMTAWGAQYVVTTVRQPDAYGMLNLALLQRAS
jgi:hypothetical protein